jgi:hypothetical protein
MSNYLFAMGSTSIIEDIQASLPSNSNECTVSAQSETVSYLVVERKGDNPEPSIHSVENELGEKENFFFKGWFQDHDSESIAIGPSGYSEWIGSSQSSGTLDLEGAYVRARWSSEKLSIENDLFSYFPVLFFSTSDLVVASDSLFVLSKIRRALNLPCQLNHDVIYSRSWTHGLACAMMSNNTQIRGIQLLSPGKHIEVKFNRKLTLDIIHKPVKEVFLEESTSYVDALNEAIRRLYTSTMSFLHVDGIHINFGLSGGLDSRLILAILLKNSEILNKVSITTNTHISRQGDFNIVSNLAKKYGFHFNNKKQELVEHRKNPVVKSNSVNNSFGLWVLSNMGLFDMMYLHNSYWKYPNVIEIGGHGAETVKGTFSSMKFENYLHRKKMNRKFKFNRAYWRDSKLVKKSQKRYDAIRGEMARGLSFSEIDIDEQGAIQWHHLCYKSPIQNSRYLDRSTISLRPFVQKSLFSLSQSEFNPFLNVKKGEPTLLHDMLILLDPELASEPFENSKNDLTDIYIQERLDAIDVEISFDDITPYTIYGTVTDIVNGPPKSFMAMVDNLNICEKNTNEAVLEMLELQWQRIKGTKIGEIYQSAYDTAKERLLDPDYYQPSAGTPAAKIISLMMTDL